MWMGSDEFSSVFVHCAWRECMVHRTCVCVEWVRTSYMGQVFKAERTNASTILLSKFSNWQPDIPSSLHLYIQSVTTHRGMRRPRPCIRVCMRFTHVERASIQSIQTILHNNNTGTEPVVVLVIVVLFIWVHNTTPLIHFSCTSMKSERLSTSLRGYFNPEHTLAAPLQPTMFWNGERKIE